ncbi:hypothetical protein MT408_06640 [Mammaliicoccus sciuri]|nr:hypothetical protein [Mammaliicoccus sciuri]MCJ1778780.1 hypothetical protein [Mammaliicoccus sciuri]
MITSVMVIMVPLAFIFGRLSDKIGNKKVVLFGTFGLTAVCAIGFVTILFLFETTSGKALKGSYPTVSSKKDFEHVAKNPEDALWWTEQELQKGKIKTD